MERSYSNDGSFYTAGSGSSSRGVYKGGTAPAGGGGELDLRGISPSLGDPSLNHPGRPYSPSRPPTSAEIDAVIAAAMANAPPHLAPPPESVQDEGFLHRSGTPLMTNLLPSAVGADGRVNLFVGNLPYRVRWQDLKDLFRKAGTVLRADVSLGPDNRSRGYGTVLLGSREDAARAIDRFNGYTWQTRTLEVRPDRLPPEYEAQPHILHMQNQSHNPPNQHPHPHPHQHGGPHPFQNNGNGNGRAPMYPPFNNGPPPPPGGPHQHQHQHQLHHQQNQNNHDQRHQQHQGYGMSNGGGGGADGGWNNGSVHGNGMGMGNGEGGRGGRPMFNGHGGSSGNMSNYSNSNRDGQGPHFHLASANSTHAPSPAPGNPSPPSSTLGSSLPIVKDPVAGLNIAPSPLAGALTGTGGGTIPSALPIPGHPHPHPHPALEHRRGSLAPSAALSQTRNGQSPDLAHASIRASSSNLPISRPTSIVGGGLGGGIGDGFGGEGRLGSQRGSFSGSNAGEVAPHFPVQIEGLVHQGMGLGRPDNLHERVVFVSNMPLTMQWQDLKDLLRPAGLIMRADVAQDDNRKPRGYGTALFATETDAARAVNMFNGREIGGRQIRVYLEKGARNLPTQTQSLSQSSESASSLPASPANRLPWGINTSLAQAQAQATPQRPTSTSGSTTSPNGFPGGPTPGPNFRASQYHPGPISMPPFSPLHTPGSGNPLSPLQTRGLPPMTPSMPGFVFNAFLPETPGWHPGGGGHPFLSPGIAGPFSPGIPMNSPGAFGYNPFLNAAPGGPVDRFGGNGAFGGGGSGSGGWQGGSAALGTPTTMAFAPGDPVHGYGGVGSPGVTTPNGNGNGNGNANQSYFANVNANGQSNGGGGGGEYFPLIPRQPSNGGETSARGRYSTSASTGPGQGQPLALNARDRLASTSEAPAPGGALSDTATGTETGAGRPEEGLSSLISRISIASDTAEISSGAATPIGGGSPTVQREKRRLAAAAAAAAKSAERGGEVEVEEEDTRGRYSLDGDRPAMGQMAGLRVSDGAGERRASFGDAGK